MSKMMRTLKRMVNHKGWYRLHIVICIGILATCLSKVLLKEGLSDPDEWLSASLLSMGALLTYLVLLLIALWVASGFFKNQDSSVVDLKNGQIVFKYAGLTTIPIVVSLVSGYVVIHIDMKIKRACEEIALEANEAEKFVREQQPRFLQLNKEYSKLPEDELKKTFMQVVLSDKLKRTITLKDADYKDMDLELDRKLEGENYSEFAVLEELERRRIIPMDYGCIIREFRRREIFKSSRNKDLVALENDIMSTVLANKYLSDEEMLACYTQYMRWARGRDILSEDDEKYGRALPCIEERLVILQAELLNYGRKSSSHSKLERYDGGADDSNN